jgi:hypothetical protein
MAAPIGQLVVEISTDAQAFTQGLDKARGDFNRFNTTLKQGASESQQQLQRFSQATGESSRSLAEAAKSVRIMASGLATELNPVLGNVVIGVSQVATHFKSMGLAVTAGLVAVQVASVGLSAYVSSVTDAAKAQAAFNLALQSGDISGLQGQLRAATLELKEYEANTKTIVGRIKNFFTDIGVFFGGKSPVQEAARARGGIERLTPAEARRDITQQAIQLFQAQMAETEQFVGRAFAVNDLRDFELGLESIRITLDNIASSKREIAEITRDLQLLEAQALGLGPAATERISARFEQATKIIETERSAAQLALQKRRDDQRNELIMRRREITDPELRGPGPEADLFTPEMSAAMQAARLKPWTDFRVSMNQIDDVAKNLGQDFDRAGAEIDATTTALKKLGEQGVTAGDEVDELKAKLLRLTVTRDALSDIFSGLSQAVSGTVLGIVQGTQTIGQAFANMGRAISASLIENVINRGFKVLERAIEDFLNKEETRQLLGAAIKWGVSLFSGFSGGAEPVTAFQHGGIVTQPTRALIGEAGPEAVIPLSGGGGSRGPLVQVNITNQHPTADVQQRTRRGPNGSEIHDIVVLEVRRMIGNGEMDSVMSPYALRRVPTAR